MCPLPTDLSDMNYFLRRHSQAVDGPFPPERIRAWRREGRVNEVTPVRSESDSAWTELGSVMELLLDPPEETVGRTTIGGLPAWRRAGLQAPGTPEPEVDGESAEAEELTGFHWRLQLHTLLALLAFPLSLIGELIPLPGGSIFTSMGAFLLSAGPTYSVVNAAVDLRPYHHWIPIYLLIGLGFWPLLCVLHRRSSDRRAPWACLAIGFLLLDLVFQILLSGFTVVPSMFSPVHQTVGIPLLVGAILMDLEGMAYFFQFPRNAWYRHEPAPLLPWKQPASKTSAVKPSTPVQSTEGGVHPL